jgi:Tfp pilus assembly protein PilP
MIGWRIALAVCGLVAAAGAESRDPFSPPASAAPAVGTPLERLDLDQVRLVALVHDALPPRALLEDAAGIGYIVGLGTPIGRRGGTVVAIEPSRLRIREPDTDDDVVLTLGLAAEHHP